MPYHAPEENDSNHDYRTQRSRKERIKRRRKRQRARMMRRMAGLGLLLLIVGIPAVLFTHCAPEASPQQPQEDLTQAAAASKEVEIPEPEPEPEPTYSFFATENTVSIDDSFPSRYAVLIDAQSGEILAQRDSDVMINPASMTKILTLLVAAEQIQDRSGTFTMTFDITDYCYVNKCSVVGYEVGEIIPIEELFYGCILSSGADACLALAQVAAGSHEAFVELMNQKLEELGLSETAHFTNCVGIYDEAHYCTVQDMAMILKVTLENEFCKQVMGTKIYHTASTSEHPVGQDLSNWFLRSIEDLDTNGVSVDYAKRGYVSESGFCSASCGQTEDGSTYLCVTGKSTSHAQTIRDHAQLYKTYCVQSPDDAKSSEKTA